MFASLNEGGAIHHYIPSKWHPYSISLRLLGPAAQKALIPVLRPGTEDVSGYPAFFHCCSVGAMRALLAKEGFNEINFEVFYRASDYFSFFLPIYLVVAMFENLCSALNIHLFASGFIVSARKPKAHSASLNTLGGR
jgi:hypothetical protein